MKDYDLRSIPNLDDDSEENFKKTNDLIDYLYEKAKKESQEANNNI